MARTGKLTTCAAALVLAASAAFAAPPRQAGAPSANAEKQEIRDFPLTTARLDKFDAAFRAYNKLIAENPGLEKQLDEEEQAAPDANTIAGTLKILHRHAKVAAAIQSSGMPLRDYVVMTYTLIDAMAAAAMVKHGSKMDMSAKVLPANLNFCMLNFGRIEKILQAGEPDGDSR